MDRSAKYLKSLVGAPDLNRGPPAPKAGGPSKTNPPFSALLLKTTT